MLVGEVMTRDVATLTADATVADAARLFADRNISGVPVVDKRGAVIGIISEADLLHRSEIKTERPHSWWSGLFETDASLARDFVRQGARKVADIMNTDVITIRENAQLSTAANLLDKHKVKRLVVLRGETLAGIISRADIVRAFAKASEEKPEASFTRTDDDIRQALADRLTQESWAKAQFVSTHVHDGVVDLCGFVNSESQKKALRVLAENLPGVQAVRDRVKIQEIPIITAM